jgi:hypothetical protein
MTTPDAPARLLTDDWPGYCGAVRTVELADVGDGYDTDQLIRHRSRPVVVCLNVAELVERVGAPGHGPYRDQTDALDALAVDADEDVLDRLNDEAIRLYQQWQARYADYAAGFTAAVQQIATELGVPVPVRVQANTDPDDACGRPGNSGQPWADEWIDPLACALRHAAVHGQPIDEILPLHDHRASATGSAGTTDP